jgi:hypothetical protein
MSFKYYSEESVNSQPIQYRGGTNAEEFVVGEILQLTSGLLAIAAVTTAGSQKYVCLAKKTGKTGTLDIPVVELKKTTKFITTTAVQIASTDVGTAYTLTTAGTSITDTATAGVFVVDFTDGATLSTVVGRFKAADAL